MVEPEQGDITVFERVFLAFETVSTSIPSCGDTSQLRQVIVGHDFRFNKPLFETRVYDSGGLRSLHAVSESPRSDFVLARGEVIACCAVADRRQSRPW